MTTHRKNENSVIHEFSLETDAKGRIVRADRKGLAMLGCNQTDVENGISIMDFVVESDYLRSVNLMNRVLAGERLGVSHIDIQTGSGDSTSVLMNTRPTDNHRGLHMTFFVPPPSSHLADLIWEHQQVFQTVIEAIPCGLFMVDRRGKISHWNKAAEELTGVPRKDIIGQSCHQFFNCPNYEKMCPLPRLTSGSSDALCVDVSINLKGHWIKLQKRSSYIHAADGTIMGAIESFVDLTQHHKAETALSEARELVESARKAKRHFMANMNHEIRTPLNGIMGFLNLMEAENPPPSQLEYIANAKRTTHLLMDLINNILDFNIVGRGDVNIEVSGFSLSSVISSVISRQYDLSSSKQIYVHSHVDNDVPDNILGDSVRLYQILKHLVGNGIKFTKNGKVAIHVSRASNQTNHEKPSRKVVLHFMVSDTGVGIPQEKLELIFESLSQVDGSQTRSYGGLGIGLNIVHRLVQLLDGRIWMDSTTGEGTAVHFVLPFISASSVDMDAEIYENQPSPLPRSPLSDAENQSLKLAPLPLAPQWHAKFKQLGNWSSMPASVTEILILELKSLAQSANQPALAALLFRLLLSLRREDSDSVKHYYSLLTKKSSSDELSGHHAPFQGGFHENTDR